MLFSNEDVARTVNQDYEAVWESVRPVPVVRIDFGNGAVITRTLHGNIATYVCNAAGEVLDVLPGIYEPRTYLSRLKKLRLLAAYASTRNAEQRMAFLSAYHQREATTRPGAESAPQADETTGKSALPQPAAAAQRKAAMILPITKGVIEKPVETLVAAGGAGPVPGNPPPRPAAAIRRADMPKSRVEKPLETVVAAGGASPEKAGEEIPLTAPEDLANWKLLAEDTRHNETIRRRQIHEMLASAGLVRPETLTRRIYKEVLHADLDDPYLGLGKVLFENYPFGKEAGTRN